MKKRNVNQSYVSNIVFTKYYEDVYMTKDGKDILGTVFVANFFNYFNDRMKYGNGLFISKEDNTIYFVKAVILFEDLDDEYSRKIILVSASHKVFSKPLTNFEIFKARIDFRKHKLPEEDLFNGKFVSNYRHKIICCVMQNNPFFNSLINNLQYDLQGD